MNTSKIAKYFWPFLSLVVITLLLALKLHPNAFWLKLFAIVFVFLSICLISTYFCHSKDIKGGGLASLLLTMISIFTIELSLRAIPDTELPKEITIAPPLTTGDRGNVALRKNGFRGKRPCKECPKNNIRIVTMGGSSTYGIPLFNNRDTYSAELQRLLDESRPDEHYEVLNAGIPGYGITQILDSLEKEVLKSKPDIVTICAWFNDSSNIPNWYSLGNQSDMDAYKFTQVLEKIENFPGFKTIYSSRLIGLLRYTILRVKQKLTQSGTGKVKKIKSKKRPRMNPEEFRGAMEKLQKLSEQYNFLPVFIYEPLNRTGKLTPQSRGYKYYAAETELANQYGIPVVDTLSEFEKHRSEWLFYDFIHPNRDGHKLIAEVLYDKLFSKQQTQRTTDFWKVKNIDLTLPRVRKENLLQFEREKITGKVLKITLRAPYASYSQKIQINIDTVLWEQIGEVGKEFKELTVSLDNIPGKVPIVDFSLLASELTGKQSLIEIQSWSIE